MVSMEVGIHLRVCNNSLAKCTVSEDKMHVISFSKNSLVIKLKIINN